MVPHPRRSAAAQGANRLFRKLPSDADWTMVNAGAATDANGYGTGGAIGDFDGDGRLELVVSHGESASQPLSLFKPLLGTGNAYLRVKPLTRRGAPARGAVVTLSPTDVLSHTQLKVIDGARASRPTLDRLAKRIRLPAAYSASLRARAVPLLRRLLRPRACARSWLGLPLPDGARRALRAGCEHERVHGARALAGQRLRHLVLPRHQLDAHRALPRRRVLVR